MEATYYNLFSLSFQYKYLSLQTISTNLNVGSAAVFHKTIRLTSSQVIWLKGIWFDSKFGQVPMKKNMLNFVFVLMNV